MASVNPSLSSAITYAGLTGAVPSMLTNAIYRTWEPVWRDLAAVYEGSGGFLDGGYIVPHPREWLDYKLDSPVSPTKKLKNRRKLARYENIAAPIVDGRRDALFKAGASRRLENQTPTGVVGADRSTIESWWMNVDGRGTSLDQFWYEAWTYAGVFGHVFILMDSDPAPPGAALTKADVRPPYLCLYTPLDVPDWTTDRQGNLTSVRFLESIPRPDVGLSLQYNYRVREITPQGWTQYDVKAPTREGLERSEPTSGTYTTLGGALPVVVLYAKRKVMTSILGESVLGSPKLYIDLYNISSEIRDLMRSQTFGYLHIELGPGYTAKQAKEDMGDEVGVDNVLFSSGKMAFISPDPANVEVHQKERQELLRSIYRLTRTPWEGDTRDAESAEALRTKREDFELTIFGHLNEIERADRELARLWYQWTQGAARADALMAQDGLSITWNRTFAGATTKDEIEDVLVLEGMDMGPTFEVAVKRKLALKKLPNLDQETQRQIEQELTRIARERDEASTAQRKAAAENPVTAGGVSLMSPGNPGSPDATSRSAGGAEPDNDAGTGLAGDGEDA